MRILNRYILKEVVPPFFLSLVVFSFILLINLLFQLAEMVVEQGFSLTDGILYFLSALPSLLSLTIPISMPAGVLVGVSSLASEREIVAMRAGGVNVSKLLAPLVTAGGLISLILLYVNLALIPFVSSFQERLNQNPLTGKMVTRSLRPNQFFDRIPDLLIFVKEFDEKEDCYKNLLIYQNPKEGTESMTVARSAKVLEDKQSGGISFLVMNGQTRTFQNKTPGKVETASFEQQILKVDFAQKPASPKKDLLSMTTPVLFQRAFPEKGTEKQDDNYIFKYEFSRRIANSLVVIVFILLAFPLGMANIGNGKGAGFTLSIILVLFYWVMQSGMGNLALKGKLEPMTGAYAPIAILFAGAAFLNLKSGEKMWRVRERLVHLFFSRRGLVKEDAEKTKEKQSRTSIYSFKTLDKYLLSLNARFFFIVLFALLCLDWVIATRGLVGYLSGGGKIVLFVKYLAVRSVGLAPVLAPFAILITILIVTALLERRSELIAVKASGISLFRISYSFLTMSLVLSFFILLLQETIMPGANQKAIRLKDSFKNYYSRHLASDEDVWLYSGKEGVLYHYNFYDREEKVFQGFSLYLLDKETLELKSRFRAKRASFAQEHELNFKKGWWWRCGPENGFEFKEKGNIKIPHDKAFLVLPAYLDAETLSMKKLKKLINNLSEKGIKTTRLSVEYYKKIADGFASFVLVLIGLPFAFLGGRKGSLYGISIALGLSLLYYTVSAVFKALGQMEWLDPSLASLFPMLLFSLIGAMLLLKIRS